MQGCAEPFDDATAARVGKVRAAVAADFAHADAAHDVAHLDRVARLAATIAVQEGLDGAVAAMAAYVHDYHRLEELRTGRTVEPPECAHLARAALARAGVPEPDRGPVLAAVAATARAFVYGGTIGEPIWVPGDPLAARYSSGRTSSVVAHFYEKLVHLSGELCTPAGRALGAPRHRVLLEFLEQFHAEFGDVPPVSPAGTPAAP